MHVPLCGMQSDPDSVGAVLRHLRTSSDDEPNALWRKVKIIDHICRMVLEEWFAAKEQNDEYLGHVAVTATYLGDKSLFGEARQQICQFWPDECWSELGGLIGNKVSAVDIQEQALPRSHWTVVGQLPLTFSPSLALSSPRGSVAGCATFTWL